MVEAKCAGAAAGKGSRTARPTWRTRRTDAAARRRANGKGILPPAVAQRGHEKHNPHDLHENRLVVAGGESCPRDRSSAAQSAACTRVKAVATPLKQAHCAKVLAGKGKDHAQYLLARTGAGSCSRGPSRPTC